MKEPIVGLVPGPVAVTAAGRVSIAAERPAQCRARRVGRCDVCGLEKAAWSGQGVRLCTTCYQREVRRGIAAGAGAPAEA